VLRRSVLAALPLVQHRIGRTLEGVPTRNRTARKTTATQHATDSAEPLRVSALRFRENLAMPIAKVVRKTTLRGANDDARDLAYWLSRPMAERIAAVEELRRPVLEALPLDQQKLQRVYQVTTHKEDKSRE
jgi:hypothetical protein